MRRCARQLVVTRTFRESEGRATCPSIYRRMDRGSNWHPRNRSRELKANYVVSSELSCRRTSFADCPSERIRPGPSLERNACLEYAALDAAGKAKQLKAWLASGSLLQFRGCHSTQMLLYAEAVVLSRMPTLYPEAGHRVTGLRCRLGLDFGRGSATLNEERPRVVPRGFCFDPVRRISSAWFEDSPSRESRGCSSAGRALQSHCRGQGFDPPQLHCFFN